MTQTKPANPERPNRGPYIAAVAFFALLILVGIIALLPKLRHRDELKVEAEAVSGPPIVLATRLKTGDAGGHLELPASIQAFDQTPIFARTSGYVKARYVDIGDHVTKGQLLAEIDDPQTAQSLLQAQATLLQAKAQLAQAQANAVLSKVTDQRWDSLQKQGVVAQQDADQKRAQAGADAATVAAAQANIAAGEANVRNLTEQASFARVVAPFSGIVLSRSIDNGSLISSGSQTGVTQMFSIGQSDTVRVFTNVPQSNAVGLHNGQTAKVAVAGASGTDFHRPYHEDEQQHRSRYADAAGRGRSEERWPHPAWHVCDGNIRSPYSRPGACAAASQRVGGSDGGAAGGGDRLQQHGALPANRFGTRYGQRDGGAEWIEGGQETWSY